MSIFNPCLILSDYETPAMQTCCSCGEKCDQETMNQDHDGHWFCKECDEKN